MENLLISITRKEKLGMKKSWKKLLNFMDAMFDTWT